jgi:hypothetical protein
MLRCRAVITPAPTTPARRLYPVLAREPGAGRVPAGRRASRQAALSSRVTAVAAARPARLAPTVDWDGP